MKVKVRFILAFFSGSYDAMGYVFIMVCKSASRAL